MSEVKFAKGSKLQCQEDNVTGTLYFTTDTKEILLNGSSYGGKSVEQGTFDGSAKTSGKVTLDLSSGDNVEIAMPSATSNTSGLMSATDKADVGEMKQVLYELFAKATLTANKTVIEKGVSTEISVTGKFLFNEKDADANLTLSSGSTTISSKTGTTITHTESLSDSKPYTISALKVYNTAGDSVTKTASVTVNAYYPKFYGGNAKTALAEADILALTKQAINGSASGTYNITCADNQYIWFCIPSTMNINKVTMGGFTFPIEAAVNVTVTGKGTYKCYRSQNLMSAGTRSFVIS